MFDDFTDCDSEVKEYEHVMIGAVFVPEHVCLVVIVKRGRQLHVVDEFVSFHDTRAAIDELKERHETNSVEVYPGLTGRTKNATNNTEIDWKLMRNAGYRVKSNEYDVPTKEIVIACNEAFENKLVKVNKYKCPTLTLALETQQWDDNGLPLNENGNFWINEAFGYPIYNILKIKRSGAIVHDNSNESNRVGGY